MSDQKHLQNASKQFCKKKNKVGELTLPESQKQCDINVRRDL